MIHIVLRTCDRHSLQNTRIVNKKECILRCLNSLLVSLSGVPDKHLHIIDDNSSTELKDILTEVASANTFISLNFLPERDLTNISPKKISRHSVSVAYNYIYNLPDDDLVYIVEDDYLHYPTAIEEMVDSWKLLKSYTGLDVGIFPQDFNQLYYHPSNPFNSTYVTPCMVVPGSKKYYRTTWFTQESFLIQVKAIKKYRQHFDALLTIGDNEYNWEGNTISNVWRDPQFQMFMPLGTHAIHMSNKNDISFFVTKDDVIKLWNQNKTIWSLEQDSQVQL